MTSPRTGTVDLLLTVREADRDLGADDLEALDRMHPSGRIAVAVWRYDPESVTARPTGSERRIELAAASASPPRLLDLRATVDRLPRPPSPTDRGGWRPWSSSPARRPVPAAARPPGTLDRVGARDVSLGTGGRQVDVREVRSDELILVAAGHMLAFPHSALTLLGLEPVAAYLRVPRIGHPPPGRPRSLRPRPLCGFLLGDPSDGALADFLTSRPTRLAPPGGAPRGPRA
ncbi:MAG: hypothetical protein U5R31_02915 [Acidimicrobiia bacterium]|nr:hypothetical protein [Acidimicrobiia bacterium]